MSAFIDSSVLIAFYSERDENHAKAVELIKKAGSKEYGAIFISDYVFNECVNFILAKTKDVRKAAFAGDKILASDAILLQVSSSAFSKSWELFKKYDVLSLTDCTNIQLMKENNIEKIITFDSGFKRIKEIEVIDRT